MATWKASELREFVRVELTELADPAKAVPMQRYLKTEMPFLGIQQPQRKPVSTAAIRKYPVASRRQYEAGVRALWKLPHREEKYTAIDFADQAAWCTLASYPLYQRMIREGAWWDFVDPISIGLVGYAWRTERAAARVELEKWLVDDDFWVRRAAILSQLRLKGETDIEFLERCCLECAHEKEFFIRKALGWALRQYSYTDADWVSAFIDRHRDRLSPLTIREGAKRL